MRPVTKFFILALAFALNAASAHAHDLHPISTDKLRKALGAREENGHARKLLGGSECLQHTESDNFDPLNNIYEGKCGALAKKAEGHWCDTADSDFADFINDELGLPPAALAELASSLCVADSTDDCCEIESGALAGVVIGCFVGLVGIITLFAFCCKCCCFRRNK